VTMMTARPAVRMASTRVRLPAAPEAAAMARLRVRELLESRDAPVEADAVDVAVLAASELVTNAVQAEPSETVTLGLALRAGCLRIAVLDTSPEPPAVREAAPGELTEDGRGLALVAALASCWGWHRIPGGGKAVYAEIKIGPS
jgi:anti-sigma regulatory factor (Ser/Thr protein kinase)